ncbi:MAG: hypothetical protein ABIZ04_26850 [Opitutus sp.]
MAEALQLGYSFWPVPALHFLTQQPHELPAPALIVPCSFSRRPLMIGLVSISTLLVVARWAGLLLHSFSSYSSLKGTIPLFELGDEANVPTYFSSFFLLIAAVSVAAVASAKSQLRDRNRSAWWGLAAVFFLLSLDETAHVHEWSANVVRPLVGSKGIFSYAWVACGLVFVLGCGVAFARLLFSLPRAVLLQFVFAGVLYLGGALGLEIVEGYYDRLHGHDFGYGVLVNTEETLEIAGTLLFVHAVLGYLMQTVEGFQLQWTRPTGTAVRMAAEQPSSQSATSSRQVPALRR